jgi:hypothetical protein
MKMVMKSGISVSDEARTTDKTENVDTIVRKAWMAREYALTLGRSIQTELRLVFSCVVISDILCLVASVGEVLAPETTFQRIRLAGSMVLYVTSLFSVIYGLICVAHEVQRKSKISFANNFLIK